MSEALLQAVLEHPESNEPRLAYAAWCAEQSDDANKARAEFIRTEIEITNLPQETVNLGGAYPLQARAARLSDTYGAIWAADIAPFVQSYTFERGFIALVKLTASSFMEHSAALFAAAPVEHVDLTGVRDVREDLFASAALARLRSLSMDHCGLYDFHLRLLSASTHVARLGWLSVAENHLEFGSAQAIAVSPNFKQLKYAEFRLSLIHI